MSFVIVKICVEQSITHEIDCEINEIVIATFFFTKFYDCISTKLQHFDHRFRQQKLEMISKSDLHR